MSLKVGTRVLVTGASGQLGAYVLRELRRTGCQVVAWSGATEGTAGGVRLRPVDLARTGEIEQAMELAEPDVIIHAGAVSTPSAAFKEPARANAVNVAATALLAELAADQGARMVFLSTDIVFDGERPGGMYTERDEPSPVSIYGASKRAAEWAVADLDHVITLRLSLLFGPAMSGKPTLLDQHVAAMLAGDPVRLFHDEWRTPLSLSDATAAIVAAAASSLRGLYNLGGPQRMSRVEMGRALADALGTGHASIVECSRLSIESAEPRPADTSLDSSAFFAAMPSAPRRSYAESLHLMLRN